MTLVLPNAFSTSRTTTPAIAFPVSLSVIVLFLPGGPI
jgi:hypothetical protein